MLHSPHSWPCSWATTMSRGGRLAAPALPRRRRSTASAPRHLTVEFRNQAGREAQPPRSEVRCRASGEAWSQLSGARPRTRSDPTPARHRGCVRTRRGRRGANWGCGGRWRGGRGGAGAGARDRRGWPVRWSGEAGAARGGGEGRGRR
ncbi:hypothetical protein BS78_09G111400 [Paspalum vaginatum]|nr:hypothetical protein BS78_09G111400 [Paspalum vaginatum]